MSSLINVGTAGEHTSQALPTELGKLIVVFQERAPSLQRRRRDRGIPSGITRCLHSRLINVPDRFDIRSRGNPIRFRSPTGLLFLPRKKIETFSRSLLVERQREKLRCRKLREALSKAPETHLRISATPAEYCYDKRPPGMHFRSASESMKCSFFFLRAFVDGGL